jgi:uncharacterized cupin superfamily protein
VKEAKLVGTDAGLLPEGEGWFVVNAREARWDHVEGSGAYVAFEGKDSRFEQVGVNIHVLHPGEPNARYHGEDAQEGVLVLSGECLLLVEGHERRLRAWDYAHFPPWTEHVVVGAGDGPCAILMVGARGGDAIRYPANELALAHGAGVTKETDSGREAYAGLPSPVAGRYRDGDLPEY